MAGFPLTDAAGRGSDHFDLVRHVQIAAYNDVLGAKVVEQIYFSEFVVQ